MSAAAAYGPEWSASLRRGSEAELRSWLEFALDFAAAAEEIARRWFRAEVEVRTKADRTFVTAADTEIETLFRERLADRFPDHGVLGEEFGSDEGTSGIRWYVDPIDGTHNFMRGVPIFGVLLAAERDGELQVGMLSAPALHERWWAGRGLGAWAEGLAGTGLGPGSPRRIAVSDISSVGEAQVVFGSASDLGRSRVAQGFASLLRDAWRDRGFGDFWGYALVAEGAAEAMIEADLSAWDLAAPAILVEEAGGRLTTLAGERTIHGGSAVATNGLLHEEVLARLRG